MDRIRLNASEWMDFRSGEKKCFLLTNGLGGYCSLTVMGNAARNDQALLMGALKAPTVREHLISNVWETLEVDGEETELFSQEFVNRTQNVEGFRFLEGFEMGSLPVWFYRVKGVEIEKTIDTLNTAFEKLLDSIFEDTAMDVSSDISVLHTVLAQEGLTEDEFTKMRKKDAL